MLRSRRSSGESRAWYEDKNQDTIFYLFIALFFIELIVGGIAFFYGIIHARPEIPGGPPIARFPWLVWALSAVLAPVAFLLIVHLTGSLISSTIKQDPSDSPDSLEKEELPEGMRRFYAAVRHAPAVVVLLAILLLGTSLFFVDGALTAVKHLLVNLVPYIPWLAVSFAALLAICFVTHAILVYRQRKMENEYAWRREVLEKTGMVITDNSTRTLSLEQEPKSALPQSTITVAALPSGTPKDEDDTQKMPH